MHLGRRGTTVLGGDTLHAAVRYPVCEATAAMRRDVVPRYVIQCYIVGKSVFVGKSRAGSGFGQGEGTNGRRAAAQRLVPYRW